MVDARFFSARGPLTLGALSELSGASLYQGRPEQLIEDVAPLHQATSAHIACLHNPKYIPALERSLAGACIMRPEHVSKAPEGMAVLVSPTPYKAFALVTNALYVEDKITETKIASTAIIHPSAHLGEGIEIGDYVVIKAGAHIGNLTKIDTGTVVDQGVSIGDSCIIGSHVTLSHCILGHHVTIKPGARIGQAGFGFFMDGELGHVTMPQLGRVLIGNQVEVGANTTIDRGSLTDTVIGDGTRIDNLVQLAHNVQLGKGCVIVAQVGIAGSTVLEDYVAAGGQVGIAGHLKVGKGARIAAQSGLMRDIAPGETVAGSPAVPVVTWHRQNATLTKLVRKKST